MTLFSKREQNPDANFPSVRAHTHTHFLSKHHNSDRKDSHYEAFSTDAVNVNT